jgi:hypothetical protein
VLSGGPTPVIAGADLGGLSRIDLGRIYEALKAPIADKV